MTRAASWSGLAITQQLLAEGAKLLGLDVRAADDLGLDVLMLDQDVTPNVLAETLMATAVNRINEMQTAFNFAGGSGPAIPWPGRGRLALYSRSMLEGRVLLGMKHKVRRWCGRAQRAGLVLCVAGDNAGYADGDDRLVDDASAVSGRPDRRPFPISIGWNRKLIHD